MTAKEPNAPSGFIWFGLEVDIPICRDFIRFEEIRLGRELDNAEAQSYIAAEFHFTSNRSKQIVDTIKGEIF